MVMWLTEAVLFCTYMGWYLSYGKNLLVQSGSDVTGDVYRRVLEEHFATHGRAWYRNNWLLVDDNPRPHRARVVDAYLRKQDIIHMDWPPIIGILTKSNMFGTKLVVDWRN